jgi:hypothetical protein
MHVYKIGAKYSYFALNISGFSHSLNPLFRPFEVTAYGIRV